MIVKILIYLLIAIVPFFVLPGQNTREPKMTLALLGATMVILSVFYYGMFKPVKNQWFLAFLAYLPICIMFSLKPDIQLIGMQIYNFWIWKTLLFVAIFSIFIIAIYSIDFKFEDEVMLLKIMLWCGFIMSLYMILQYFGFDQFFHTRELPIVSLPPSARVGGTLGQPTIAAPFVAMLIPLAIYFKKYLFMAVMIIAVILTKSHVAIGAMCLSLIFILALRNKVFFITILSLVLLISVGTVYLYKTKPIVMNKIITDSGRFDVWKQVTQDINTPVGKLKQTFPFTGFGPGSFYYIYHLKHPTVFIPRAPFLQAHNEYIELLHDTGIIGLVILLGAIFCLLKLNIKFPIDKLKKYLLASFICIAICAGGTFVWHLAPHIIYTCIFVGLLSKPINLT